MATQLLLNAATANGRGTAISLSGPCSIQILGSSSMGGAYVKLLYTHDADTAANYSLASKDGNLSMDSSGYRVDLLGDYFLLAEVFNASADTSITMKASQ